MEKALRMLYRRLLRRAAVVDSHPAVQLLFRKECHGFNDALVGSAPLICLWGAVPDFQVAHPEVADAGSVGFALSAVARAPLRPRQVLHACGSSARPQLPPHCWSRVRWQGALRIRGGGSFVASSKLSSGSQRACLANRTSFRSVNALKYLEKPVTTSLRKTFRDGFELHRIGQTVSGARERKETVKEMARRTP
eukprot:scaffold228_cov312-Pinguiococcus_pyrenoidosus.AAC.22